MSNGKKLLRWYAQQARKAGYVIPRGINGGGWRVIATAACGEVFDRKALAKSALIEKFGVPAQTTATAAERKPKSVTTKRNPATLPGPATVVVGATSVEFLNSYEWRKLRMVVIRKYGRTCMCCGATAQDGIKIHVDHIKPRRLYPELALVEDNLQILCEVCNHGKGNWDMTDWRPKVAA